MLKSVIFQREKWVKTNQGDDSPQSGMLLGIFIRYSQFCGDEQGKEEDKDENSAFNHVVHLARDVEQVILRIPSIKSIK